MRLHRLALLLMPLLAACGSGKIEPEAGAILLEVRCAPGAPVPDELRVWAYDDTGRLWDGARIPAEGNLVAKNAEELGTILIQPGAIQGLLRIHVEGFAIGTRILDGIVVVDSMAGDRTVAVAMDSARPADLDGDDVPDAIDDCPGMANPQQGGCPAPVDSAVERDAAPDQASVADAGYDWPAAEGDSALDGPPLAADAAEERSPDGSLGKDRPGVDAIGPDAQSGARDDSSSGNGDVPSDWADAPSDLADALSDRPDAPSERADAPSDNRADLAPAAADVVVRLDTGVDGGQDSPSDAADAGDGAEAADTGADANSDSPGDLFDSEPSCGDGSVCNLPQGVQCNANAACASGACADGVCCTNACIGPCRSCNQPNANGVCQAYVVGSNPEGECSDGATCNGAGACGLAPPPDLANGEICSSPDQCASGFCTDGVCCDSACKDPCQVCGTGTCQPVQRTDDIPECTDGMTCNAKGKCVGG
jgi:hypothetical protein